MVPCKRSIARIAIALAAAAALASATAWAEQRDSTGKTPQAAQARPSLKALEAEFWACDYTATTRGLEATDREVCLANYEALKKDTFGGDFAALAAWWKRNKVAEYLALAESQPMGAGR
jgi:hypothetical protein